MVVDGAIFQKVPRGTDAKCLPTSVLHYYGYLMQVSLEMYLSPFFSNTDFKIIHFSRGKFGACSKETVLQIEGSIED